jgi:hypothetical protein
MTQLEGRAMMEVAKDTPVPSYYSGAVISVSDSPAMIHLLLASVPDIKAKS